MHARLSPVFSGILCAALLAGTPLQARQPGDDNKQPANVVIHLPTDAELYIEGIKSKQVGATREFETPALQPGKVFTYNLKAVWMEDGKEVVKQLKVKVEAGKTTKIDVTKESVEAPPPPPPGSYKLELPNKVLTLPPGGKQVVTVRVQRDNSKEPVKVTFHDLPAGIQIKEALIPANKDAIDIEVTVADKVESGPASVRVEASAGKVLEKGLLKLVVEKPAAKPAILRLDVPARLDGEAGKPVTIAVKVTRENFEGPITVTFEGVPDIGKPAELVIPAGKDTGTFSLSRK